MLMNIRNLRNGLKGFNIIVYKAMIYDNEYKECVIYLLIYFE